MDNDKHVLVNPFQIIKKVATPSAEDVALKMEIHRHNVAVDLKMREKKLAKIHRRNMRSQVGKL